jgi:hypothetical protein
MKPYFSNYKSMYWMIICEPTLHASIAMRLWALIIAVLAFGIFPLSLAHALGFWLISHIMNFVQNGNKFILL